MNLMFMFTLSVTAIFLAVLMIIPMINQHKNFDHEKNSPFECGFDPFSNSRLSFSIHFFSISLMFLIFDIEITLIFPIPLIKNMISMSNWMLFCLFVMTLLLAGLFMEWKEGSMEWK